MITAHTITLPFLGRRWRAYCERCHIDLPGRHPERTQALAAGQTHVDQRHAGVSA